MNTDTPMVRGGQCRCVLAGARCIAWVPPDAPFCEACETRHPTYHPMAVSAVPLGER